MAMTCDLCGGLGGVQRFASESGAKAVDICQKCLVKPAPASAAGWAQQNVANDGDTIRRLTIESERMRAERAKYSRGQYVPDELRVETWGETMEQKIAAAVQKALAAALPTFPAAPLPTSAAPDKAAAILAEDADVDFAARRDALDFDLEAARAVELLPTEPDGRPRVPDANKLAVIDLCRNRLAACKAEAELETIRKFAAQRGLLAAGAELGFKPPEPGAATDAERQKRQREFEMATAPRPGTAVREGPQRPVLSAWGSSVDPRVLNEGG